MRRTVLDLGSSSFHLAIFAGDPRSLTWRRHIREPVRLLDSVRAGRIDAAGFARGLAAVDRLLRALDEAEPGCPVSAVATAAIREADNGGAFCDEIQRRSGIRVEVLGGDDEARLTFLGARGFAGPAGRLVVVDLGGGSLELASGAGPMCEETWSTPVGVLRLCAQFAAGGAGPDAAGCERIAAAVRFAVGPAARTCWDRRPDRLVLTSGTARSLAALAHELELEPRGSVELGAGALARMIQILRQFRPVDLPGLGVEPSRSDTIAVGAVVLHTVMELLGMPRALVSPFGLREGVVVRELARRSARGGGEVHARVT